MSAESGKLPRGLPAPLPQGERILWQGAPSWRVLAQSAFAAPWVAGYFALLTVAAVMGGSPVGAAVTALVGVLGLGIIAALAWASASTTVYTLTNKRIVLQIGVAFEKHVNLPLALIGSADLNRTTGTAGDIALGMIEPVRLSFFVLWPHARPGRFREPQPMLRAVQDVEDVAAILTRACADHACISTSSYPASAQRALGIKEVAA